MYRRCSPRPGEGSGVTVLARVRELQPERPNPSLSRLGYRQRRVWCTEYPRYLGNLTLGGLRRHEVLDLNLCEVPNLYPVSASVIRILDGCSLHAQVLTD